MGMIKTAVDNLAAEKEGDDPLPEVFRMEKTAIEPMTGPVSGGGPMPADPSMAGGMPPVPPMAPPGAPGGAGVPAAAPPGMPPMDPSMLGAPPDQGGVPPMDPSMLEPLMGEGGEEDMVNDPDRDMNEDQKADTMVPLDQVKDFTVGIIEATKGKKTQEAAPPDAGGQGGQGGPEELSAPGPMGAIGGPPSAEPMSAMPKLSDIQKQMQQDLG